eukprot:GILK01012319.1.p1 GENE.GILK01012319.1~~GILK01012319.1.p1  ORF type:complete len:182 (-),score=14.68 GILK01012319.1:151-696(-)
MRPSHSLLSAQGFRSAAIVFSIFGIIATISSLAIVEWKSGRVGLVDYQIGVRHANAMDTSTDLGDLKSRACRITDHYVCDAFTAFDLFGKVALAMGVVACVSSFLGILGSSLNYNRIDSALIGYLFSALATSAGVISYAIGTKDYAGRFGLSFYMALVGCLCFWLAAALHAAAKAERVCTD